MGNVFPFDKEFEWVSLMVAIIELVLELVDEHGKVCYFLFGVELLLPELLYSISYFARFVFVVLESVEVFGK